MPFRISASQHYGGITHRRSLNMRSYFGKIFMFGWNNTNFYEMWRGLASATTILKDRAKRIFVSAQDSFRQECIVAQARRLYRNGYLV